MDYYRPHRTLVVLRWRQYGAAREKQVFWASCCVFTGRRSIQAMEMTGRPTSSVWKAYSVLSLPSPHCKTFQLFNFLYRKSEIEKCDVAAMISPCTLTNPRDAPSRNTRRHSCPCGHGGR